MKKKPLRQAPMERAKSLFEESGMSLEDLGQKMGYEGDTARKSAWQFLNKTADPRLSMLQKFAKAIDSTVSEIVGQ